MSTLSIALGDNIKMMRKRKRYSLRRLARDSHVAKSTIWDIEHGVSRDPGIFTVQAICKALGVSIYTALTADLRPTEQGDSVLYTTYELEAIHE